MHSSIRLITTIAIGVIPLFVMAGHNSPSKRGIASSIGANEFSSSVIPVRHHPHDVCSVVRLAPNFPQDTSVFSASYGSMNLFLRSRNRGFGWDNTRSGMLGYKIRDIAIAPDCEQSELIFVALAEAGLQRSSDGGTIWEPPLLRSHITEVEVGELKEGKRLIVAAGTKSVVHSMDGGDNWETLGSLSSVVTALALPSGATERMFVAVGTNEAVLIKNGDRAWTSAAVPSPVHCIKFSPDFANDQTIWIGTFGHGLFVSRNAGKSFEPTVGESPPLINDIVVAPTWPQCQDIFVATPRDGVHATRDGAETWSKLNLPIAETYQTDNHFQCLAIASNYPAESTVYCGCYEGLYCSNDGGEHWFETILNPTRIGRKVAVSPEYEEDGTVFMSGYGNPILATRDRGDSWETLSRSVRMMSPYSLATSPTYAKDKLVLLGTGNGIRRSTDGGRHWDAVPLTPVSPSKLIGSFEVRQINFSPDFASDNSCFAVTAAGFYVSKDAGQTWSGKAVPIDWTWRMAISPTWNKTKTAFLGGYNVWRTDDGGDTWRQLAATGKVLGLLCAPDFETSGEIYLVSQQRGLMRSRDRGETWTAITGSFMGFSPTKLRLSPNFLNDNTVFVSTVSGGMFKSTDRGDSWQHCAPLGGLSDACFDFVISPNYTEDATLFGCVFGGMIRSTDDAKTWTLLTDTELFDDERDPWIFRGDWVHKYNIRNLGFGVHRANVNGATASIGFTGSALALYGETTPDSGICEILVDGKLVATVDLYSANPDKEFLVYRDDALPQGFHDICVRVTGQANPKATNTWVAVDGMTVRYAAVDDNNKLFADLSNLYLDENASYGRDTKNQNKKVRLTRAKIDAGSTEGSSKPSAGDPDLVKTRSEDLRAHLLDVKKHIESLTASLELLKLEVAALDEAIRVKEIASQQASKSRK